MDYPHGHRHRDNSHHTHHGSDRRDDDREYPPPPFGFNDPPPPQVYHSSHSGPTSDAYHAPPPPNIPSYAPPPPAGVEHHRHFPHFGPSSDAYDAPPPPNIPNYGPPPPAADHRHHFPHGRPSSDARYDPPPPAMENPNRYPQFPSRADQPHAEAEWAKKPSVRMYSKAERDFSLTIREGKVILARSNPSDPLQHWVKDERYSIRVKDEEGFPSFALVNKATGQAMKHAVGATQPVQLIPYNPDILDESILWTESKDLGDGYRAIRMVNNIRLNVDAFNGDKNHGVHDGTTIVLWEWKKGDNQRWKIVPH